jgi:precorrin-6A/cobalt-precorrin-6A reductase
LTLVLILGGTSEARSLASVLVASGATRVVSSLAGRVSAPALPAGEVRIGGFGGVAGLVSWLASHRPAVVVDATHPYAATMSAHAVAACQAAGVPLLGVTRPGWSPGPGDVWHLVPSLSAAASVVGSLGRRAFVTTGRQGLAAFAPVTGVDFLVRCVDPPAEALPASCTVLLARGPYAAAAERSLMVSHGIDVLVTKDSGGAATAGKLAAARELGIPVVVVTRPSRPDYPLSCSSAEVAARMVLRHWVLRHGLLRHGLLRPGLGPSGE